MIVFLIGYMGSGKSSLGRKVAKATGFRFVDMDSEVEDACGCSVAEVFASKGEEYFRRCERETLEAIAASREDTVVATGGGVPCFGDNMEVMNGAGETIYLKMSPPRLLERLRHRKGKRPIIKDMDDRQLLAFIEEKLPEREKFYAKASMVINCDGASDEYVVRHITDYLSGQGKV